MPSLLLTVAEGYGNPLQYSCLENSVDRGVWWAPVYGVAQSRTWLKWLGMHACIGEGNGNPLQYSCLENSVDRGVWWATVHGVAQSRTWLKWLGMHACVGEGNGNPLQYSCLQNPRDRGAWWAASMGSHRVGHDRSNCSGSSSSYWLYVVLTRLQGFSSQYKHTDDI